MTEVFSKQQEPETNGTCRSQRRDTAQPQLPLGEVKEECALTSTAAASICHYCTNTMRCWPYLAELWFSTKEWRGWKMVNTQMNNNFLFLNTQAGRMVQQVGTRPNYWNSISRTNSHLLEVVLWPLCQHGTCTCTYMYTHTHTPSMYILNLEAAAKMQSTQIT